MTYVTDIRGHAVLISRKVHILNLIRKPVVQLAEAETGAGCPSEHTAEPLALLFMRPTQSLFCSVQVADTPLSLAQSRPVVAPFLKQYIFSTCYVRPMVLSWWAPSPLSGMKHFKQRMGWEGGTGRVLLVLLFFISSCPTGDKGRCVTADTGHPMLVSE